MTEDGHIPGKSSTVSNMPISSREERRDLEEDGFIKKVGSNLIHSFFTALKTIQLYQLNNDVVLRTLSEFMQAIEEIIREEGKAVLRISTEFFNINGVRISMDSHSAGTYLYLIEEMKKREVEAIEFHAGLSAAELGRFLKLFNEVGEGEGAFDSLQLRQQEASIRNIEAFQWIERERRLIDDGEKQKNIRSESNIVFFRTVNLMKGILQAIEEKNVIQVRKAKRLTQQMTDIIQTDESILLGLASIKDFDEYTYSHCVNVCILSMLTGDRLRLYKQDIARLGIAALFHDIGKVHIPASIINNKSTLSKDDWELMKYHTFFGAIELARVKALNEIVDAMFAALQHHIHFNMNGYPQRPDGWDLRLFTRIVTVADYYDAMTSSRTYRTIPVPPDKALQFILMKSGEVFDPLIVKTFIQAIGIYPIGTVVELNTGERAVVVKQNPECRFIHRPTVQIITPHPGHGKKIVDLTKRSSGEYLFHRSIVRILHDDESGIDKKACFMTE